MTAGTIIQRPAGDIMPGDCVRISGCWETVFSAEDTEYENSLFLGETVRVLSTESGDHRMAATAMVETVEEES